MLRCDYIIKIVDNKLSVKKEHGETKLYNLENIDKELDPIVEKEMEGFSAPKTDGKLSLRSSLTGELVFDNVKMLLQHY